MAATSASTRYSPLDQINAGNFNKLEVAWRFKTDSLGPRPEYQFEATPLMVHGVLYTTAGSRRAVVALDAATGEMLWMHSENEGERGRNAPRQLSGRGLAYWTDGKEERILYVTPGYRLIALDAKTGIPVPSFGKNGVVDLKLDDDQEIDLVTGEVGLHSTPVVAKNVVIVGAAHLTGGVPKSKKNVKGYVRGFDVRTGKRLWIFHTIPQPGEFGNDTWVNDSWSYTGNTGVWGQISVDEELGLVYLPVELPTGDYYGGASPRQRPVRREPRRRGSANRQAQVALPTRAPRHVGHGHSLRADPGRHHRQRTHRQGGGAADQAGRSFTSSIAPPASRSGRSWRRPVPQGDVPGEWYSPTQPFPTKPPAYDEPGRLDRRPDRLHAGAASRSRKDRRRNIRIGPLFTPPSVSKSGWPAWRRSFRRAASGGANWPGGSYDPETHTLYVFSQTAIAVFGLGASPNPEHFRHGIRAGNAESGARTTGGAGSSAGGGRTGEPAPAARAGRGGRGGGAAASGEGGGRGLTVRGLPLAEAALRTHHRHRSEQGRDRWQIAHGETPDNIRNNPALKGVNIPRTGRPGMIGTLMTKTLVIAGEAGFFTTPSGQRGAMLRAYDKATGKEVGAVYMPAPQSGSPMTYMLNGQQYIVVAVSGGSYSGELIAFRLPN